MWLQLKANSFLEARSGALDLKLARKTSLVSELNSPCARVLIFYSNEGGELRGRGVLLEKGTDYSRGSVSEPFVSVS